MKRSLTKVDNAYFQMDLSVQQKEIFSGLDLSTNPTLEAYQRNAAAELAGVYEQGARGIARDKWKASRYREKAHQDALKPTYFKTASVYFAHNWIRSTVSMLSRVISVLDLIGMTTLNMLNSLIQVSGFTHAIVLCVDIGIIFKALFIPSGEVEKKLSYFERLSNILKKDERARRMLNAVIWIGVSLATIYVTGGLSVVAGLALHTITSMSTLVCNTVYSLIKWLDLQTHVDYSHAINERKSAIIAEERMLAELAEEKFLSIQVLQKRLACSGLSKAYQAIVEEEIECEILEIARLITLSNELQRDFNNLSQVHEKVNQKIRVLNSNRILALASAGIVMLAVAVMLFPPFLGATFVAAAFVLTVGSILDGFGKKLFNTLKSYFKPKAKPKADLSVKKIAISGSTLTLHHKLGGVSKATSKTAAPHQVASAIPYSRLWAKANPTAEIPLPKPKDYVEDRPFAMVL